MIVPSYSDAYWIGEPTGYSSPIIYGTARGGLVSAPTPDVAYQSWLADGFRAWPWPQDETGTVTTAALDAGLAVYGLPPTGLTAPSTADLVAYANAKQWRLATGGYTIAVAGAALLWATDDVSRALITGKAVRLMQPNAQATVDWQFQTGFVTMTAAEFTAAATQIADFVQATFDAVKPVLAAIVAGTITTTAQIDAAAWPSNVSATPVA